jgi:type IV secretory pathway VirB2 component (pilin)
VVGVVVVGIVVKTASLKWTWSEVVVVGVVVKVKLQWA